MSERAFLFIERPQSVTFVDEYRRINRYIHGVGEFSLTKAQGGFILGATPQQIDALLNGALRDSGQKEFLHTVPPDLMEHMKALTVGIDVDLSAALTGGDTL